MSTLQHGTGSDEEQQYYQHSHISLAELCETTLVDLRELALLEKRIGLGIQDVILLGFSQRYEAISAGRSLLR